MTLIDDDESAEPRTHALIIGAGSYPHLLGGTGKTAGKTFGLGQLEAPERSALHFSQWLQNDFRNCEAPLGSIEVLTSTPGKDDHEATNSEAIRASFSEWLARCDRNADNIAWFYFCGHGLRKATTLALLMSDFGRDRNKWLGAIDFTKTFSSMCGALVRTQVFLLDACQASPWEVLDEGSIEGINLAPESPLSHAGKNAIAVFAAAPGEVAAAPRGEASYFTNVLLDALKGQAAERANEENDWAIYVHSLGLAVFDHAQNARGYRDADGPSLMMHLRRRNTILCEIPRESPPPEPPLRDGYSRVTYHNPELHQPTVSEPFKIGQVYCYCAREDRSWLDTILNMVTPLIRDRAKVFTDDDVPAGGMIAEVKQQALDASKVAVLIFSSHFQARDMPEYDRERRMLILAHKRRKLPIVIVKATSCSPEKYEFEMAPVLDVPLVRLHGDAGKLDAAYDAIAMAIQEAVMKQDGIEIR